MSTTSRWTAFLLLLRTAPAADLRDRTLSAWDEYVRSANNAMLDRLRPDHPFLWIDEHPALARQLRQGNLVIVPAEPNPKRVPNGLIHHWIGAVFLPNFALKMSLRSCVIMTITRMFIRPRFYPRNRSIRKARTISSLSS